MDIMNLIPNETNEQQNDNGNAEFSVVNELQSEQKKVSGKAALAKFRKEATEQEWKDMVEFWEKCEHDQEAFKAEYIFSWSGIQKDATEKGYYTPKRKTKPVQDQAIVHADTDTEFQLTIPTTEIMNNKMNTRSFQILPATAALFEKFCHEHPYNPNNLIFNQLLREAMEKYGYSVNQEKE